jgi:hypothetical protein
MTYVCVRACVSDVDHSEYCITVRTVTRHRSKNRSYHPTCICVCVVCVCVCCVDQLNDHKTRTCFSSGDPSPSSSLIPRIPLRRRGGL